VRDRRATCRHFTGTQNDRCEAGISYKEARSAPPKLPCLADEGETCEKYSAWTQEELDEQEADLKRRMDRMAAGLSGCCEAPLDVSRVIPSGRHKGHGPRYCSKCKKLAFMV
jgi:hypothetical protein